jgi:NADH-quinone oxidoreductase subunit L
VPLILLAIPSVIIGYFTIEPILFGGWLSDAITVAPANDVVAKVGEDFHGAFALGLHGFVTLPFWLMMGGLVLATIIYLFRPSIADSIRNRFSAITTLLDHKYYFDELYQKVFAKGSVKLGQGLWMRADAGFIDGFLVNGSARLIAAVAARVRRWQTGFLYDYAFTMIIGLIALLGAWVVLL